MIRLRNAHRGECAAVIAGGPSLLEGGYDFGRLRDRGFTTFLETKALTPRLLESGFTPDYYLMSFPEKAKDNSLQHFVYRSLLAGVRIDGLLREPYKNVPQEIRDSFDDYFESWRPHRGPHKRYRWRPDVYLDESPFQLIERIPRSRIIVNRSGLRNHFPSFPYADRAFEFEVASDDVGGGLDAYFNPAERDGLVWIRGVGSFYNSASIALYPLLHYMGFRDVYFLGMDMSMLGTMEYASFYTFRSMAHFWWFFHRSRHVFNANYRANGWLFRRPQSEFEDLRTLWNAAPMTLTRVYEPWKYASAVEGIRTIGREDFERLVA